VIDEVPVPELGHRCCRLKVLAVQLPPFSEDVVSGESFRITILSCFHVLESSIIGAKPSVQGTCKFTESTGFILITLDVSRSPQVL
jgi:hypothetical protein